MTSAQLSSVHELKVWPQFYSAIESGDKTFEYRRDDRRFAVGDVLRLREYRPPSLGEDEYGCVAHFAAEYTGRECLRRVTYIARGGDIIPEGFCVMSIVPEPVP